MKRFLHIIALVFALASPAAFAYAQGLEAESLADEFSLADFVDGETDEAEYAILEQWDVGEPEPMVAITDQSSVLVPGFRTFARVSYGGWLVEDDLGTGSDSFRSPPLYFYYDFDDLHVFNIRFGNLNVRQYSALTSLELTGQHLWDWEHGLLDRRPKWRAGLFSPYASAQFGSLPVADLAGPTPYEHNKGDGLLAYLFSGYKTANYLAYGLRGNRGRDEFYWSGNIDGISSLGITFADTRTTNYLVGPQVSIGRVAERGPWRLDLSGHLMMGYSRVRSKQVAGFGQNIISSGLNNSAVAQPTLSRARNVTESFGQHAEMRLTTSYHVHQDWTIDLTLRGFVTGPWHESRELVVYSLPDFGLRTPRDEILLGGNLFLGMTFLR